MYWRNSPISRRSCSDRQPARGPPRCATPTRHAARGTAWRSWPPATGEASRRWPCEGESGIRPLCVSFCFSQPLEDPRPLERAPGLRSERCLRVRAKGRQGRFPGNECLKVLLRLEEAATVAVAEADPLERAFQVAHGGTKRVDATVVHQSIDLVGRWHHAHPFVRSSPI